MPRRASSSPSPRANPSSRRSASRQPRLTRLLGFPPWSWGLVLAGGFGLLMLLRMLGPVDRVQLRAQAVAAEQAKDWATALRLWRRSNNTLEATGMTHLGEGRACLALGRAGDA